MVLRLALAGAVVTTALSAQAIVSPVGYQGAEGNTATLLPWTHTSSRYLQVHGDLGSTPRLIRSLAFRTESTYWVPVPARTVTLELFAGDANRGAMSATFTSNYVGTRNQVIATRNVSLPNRAIPSTTPAPFDPPLLFDFPYLHAGAFDLAWEVVVSANTNTTSCLSDLQGSAFGAPRQAGSYVMNGTGCTTSTGAFELRSLFATTATDMTVGWTYRHGEPGAYPTLLLGTTDPDLAIPGLCGSGRLRTDAQLQLVGGRLDARGEFTLPMFPVPYSRALVGATLFAQGVAPDPSQPGLQVSATNGTASTIPDTPAPVAVSRVFLTGSTGPTGTVEASSALITRFQ